MDELPDVVNHVGKLLDSGKYKDAISVPNDSKYAQSFKDNCWDLIPVIVNKIEDNTITLQPSLHSACEKLLKESALKSSPEEALLEFIEQIEVAKNDAQFSIILLPLQLLLKKLVKKRERSLEWCLNSILTYIESIPIPEYKLEGKECILMDSDSNVRRITKVYSMLPSFYQTFILELNDHNNLLTKQIITAFLISLLGKPLIYIDLDPEFNKKSEIWQICNIIVNDICNLEKNVLKFLPYLEKCYIEAKIQKKGEINDDDLEMSPYEHKEKINMTTLSGLFYAVLSENFNFPSSAIPQVYSNEYIVNTVLLSVVHLLSFTEYCPIMKAMCLGNVLLLRLPQFTLHTILSSVHFDFIKSLVNTAIYSIYETIRRTAVKLITNYINKFEYKGRYILIQYIINVSNHSGMIGYAISLFKNSVNEAFNNSELPQCFTGAQFKNIIFKICHLPFGAESDLVELADQIITSLNFLRYLIIKDTKNATGIMDFLSDIESDYLGKLRTGLNMSKAHYEVKLKELDEGHISCDTQVDVSINVGGNVLDSIPTENKKTIINSALNAFHLIEGLLARLCECINASKINRLQELNMESLRSGYRYILPMASVPINKYSRTQVFFLSTSLKRSSETEAEVPVTVTTTDYDDRGYEDNIKAQILEKALDFVPKFGWSKDALSSGAEAAGYPGITHGLFPNGGGDLVHYFNVKCNEQLVNLMKTWPKEDVKDSKVPKKFIENAIMTRLLMIETYKSTWPKAMAIQALPNNVPNCLATLLSLVDDICYHSGDRSVDFNWYIRRVGLAGIYKAAELFYLTDNSLECTATRNFVASRIRDAQIVQSALNLNPVSAAPQTLTAAFVTAKNILGMNTIK